MQYSLCEIMFNEIEIQQSEFQITDHRIHKLYLPAIVIFIQGILDMHTLFSDLTLCIQ